MGSCSLISTWCVAAPIERVWDVLAAPERYPDWWKGVRSVTVLEPGEGDGDGDGTLYRIRWRSALRYALEFDARVTRLQAPHLFEAQASGRLAGLGTWRLFDGPAGTVALCGWEASPTQAWTTRLARPALVRNHAHAMRRGARGLAEKLDAELVAHS
jgi:uncharacterized protein YndB with AHSA1/START domain